LKRASRTGHVGHPCERGACARRGIHYLPASLGPQGCERDPPDLLSSVDYLQRERDGSITRDALIAMMAPVREQFEATLERSVKSGAEHVAGSCADMRVSRTRRSSSSSPDSPQARQCPRFRGSVVGLFNRGVDGPHHEGRLVRMQACFEAHHAVFARAQRDLAGLRGGAWSVTCSMPRHNVSSWAALASFATRVIARTFE